MAKVWKSAAEELEKDLKKKAYLSVYYSLIQSKVTETLGDSWLWANDYSLPIDWRVGEITNVVEMLSTFAGSRDSPSVLEMRSNYRKFVRWGFYGILMPYLRRRRALGVKADSSRLPLGKAVEMVTFIGESQFLSMAGDVIDATFGIAFTAPQFVLGIQQPPSMFGPGLDQRFSGEDQTIFAEDVLKE